MNSNSEQQWLPSGKARPCPVCGRIKDGDCRISSDGQQVVCHHPKDMRPGDVQNGWAFTSNTKDGRAGHFTLDKPRNVAAPRQQPASATSSPPSFDLARLPKPCKVPPDHWANGTTLPYGPSQWVEVLVETDGDKRHIPHHKDSTGKTIAKAGPEPWPLWSEGEALEHGRGKWIAEAEGEKCAAWFHAAGVVAVSQPGHAHTAAKIQERYNRLLAAGVAGVAYLADADPTGIAKAKKCAAAAAAVGLPFIWAKAQGVWPADMVAGGSIDDAPGTAAERVAAFETHIRQLKFKPEQSHVAGNAEASSLRWSQLLERMLAAVIDGRDDDLMEMRADAISRFRRTDAQIEAALFRLHRERQTGKQVIFPPESLDLSRISGMDWLIEGFIPDNDLSLIWGDAGSGKTTAALAAAYAVFMGTGLLDHSQPAPRRSVLFIASDSGAPPLYAAMQDMGIADLPEVKQGPEQRFFVWASESDQGMTAWAADLRGCIRLLEFVKRRHIGLVLIDSCKTVCSNADLNYTDNQLVTCLLTYFKEVICPHTAVVFLNHDGTAAHAHAGAKAWKEIPSMVHRIRQEEKKDGAKTNNRRRWDVTKSRMGPTREFWYQLSNGVLQLCPEQEMVGNCLAHVVEALTNALQLQGLTSLSRADLIERICMIGGPSKKTLDNTLSTATRARHPEICRVSGKRGHYKLAPRVMDLLKGCMQNGKEQGKNSLSDLVLESSRQVPDGNSGNNAREVPGQFPGNNVGNSSDQLQRKRSAPVPSMEACTPIREAMPGQLIEYVLRTPDPLQRNESAAKTDQQHLSIDIGTPVGSGADAFDDDDDPAWGPRPIAAKML